jgi:hypothetical protein
MENYYSKASNSRVTYLAHIELGKKSHRWYSGGGWETLSQNGKNRRIKEGGDEVDEMHPHVVPIIFYP